jgi:single-strand DNA-binding protein
MKTITIAGTIGRDAEVRNAADRKVTGWSVAVDDGWGDKKTTLWFDCNWWGQRGEKVAPYLTKGGKVTVSGELSTREYDGKTKLTIEVNNVKLQGGGQERQQDSGSSDGGYGQQQNAQNNRREFDDEIPF